LTLLIPSYLFSIAKADIKFNVPSSTFYGVAGAPFTVKWTSTDTNIIVLKLRNNNIQKFQGEFGISNPVEASKGQVDIIFPNVTGTGFIFMAVETKNSTYKYESGEFEIKPEGTPRKLSFCCFVSEQSNVVCSCQGRT
jgi:hypothetical protein